MNKIQRAKDILNYFNNWNLDEGSKYYLQCNYKRYYFLTKKIDKIIAKIKNVTDNELLKILDIGPSFQTEILRKTFPELIVNTLGFEKYFSDIIFKPRLQEKHFHFDLNDVQYQEKWLKIEKHDLIIMAEVIEHLHTSPVLVLKCISTWLKNNGYLIITTPNACALHQRLRMLMGKNIYTLIHENGTAHFRYYTIAELIYIGKKSGFKLTNYTIHNYFDDGTIIYKLYNTLCAILPSRLRHGITICYKKI